MVTPSMVPGILAVMTCTTTTTTKTLLWADSARPEVSPSLQSSSKKSTCPQRIESQAISDQLSAIRHHCKITQTQLPSSDVNLNYSVLGGFLLSLSPLSNVLLGWRDAGGLGAADVYVWILSSLIRVPTDSILAAPTTSSVVY